MPIASSGSVEPYNFDPDFERALIVLLCQTPKLYARIGKYLEAKALGDPVATRLFQVCQAIAQESGAGPGNDSVVFQRLNRLREEGKVTQEQINECLDYAEEAEDAGFPDFEQVLNEVKPILKRRKQREALSTAVDSFGKRKDMSPSIEELQRLERLGEVDEVKGLKVTSSSAFDAINELHGLVRLGFDVPEIEAILDGGLWRRGLGIVVAGPGGGKSVMLSHTAANAIRNPKLVTAFATLELPKPIILARLFANLAEVPIDKILNGGVDIARRKIDSMQLGECFIEEFAPKVTTVDDIKDFVSQVEDTVGRAVDLLVIDYADKLGTRKLVDSSYQAMGQVYESLRYYAVEKNFWLWTASQPQRAKDKGRKQIEIDHLADSQEKIRVADMVLAIDVVDDQLSFRTLKNRMGIAGQVAGPLPHEFEMGRIAPIVPPISGYDV